MKEITLTGGGTLARFIIDIISRNNDYKIIGYFDDVSGVLGKHIKYLGAINEAHHSPHKNTVIAIGNPIFRQKTYMSLKKRGFSFPNVIDKTALISNLATIQDSLILGPFSTVLADSKLGKGCCLMSYVNINQNTEIGDFCLIGAGTTFGNNVFLGEASHIGMSKTLPLGSSYEKETQMI